MLWLNPLDFTPVWIANNLASKVWIYLSLDKESELKEWIDKSVEYAVNKLEEYITWEWWRWIKNWLKDAWAWFIQWIFTSRELPWGILKWTLSFWANWLKWYRNTSRSLILYLIWDMENNPYITEEADNLMVEMYNESWINFEEIKSQFTELKETWDFLLNNVDKLEELTWQPAEYWTWYIWWQMAWLYAECTTLSVITKKYQ